ncbi:MAG: hypothetical protein FWH53_04245 [Leptospirales bacterium]|nr:hypothetical protein [Leptospirales bacterium]
MYNLNSKYPFLNEKLAKEAFIEEILSEIESMQRNWLKDNSDELATVENLNESRNIRIPISQQRLMNIEYLIDMLIKNHPIEIRPVFSFKFSMNQANHLKIEEKTEYTCMMKDSQYNQLQLGRDRESTESLNELIKAFKLFNLTKLIRRVKNKDHLAYLIKAQLGTNIFSLKNSYLDKNGLAVDEDFCFHKDNYNAVKLRLDLDEIKKIITFHEQVIARRLKSYGILNANVNDYRDQKLDYILNILSDDLSLSFDKSDGIKVKNFKNLRECIIKVEQLLDPATMLDSEILNYIQEKFMTTDRDIISLFPDMTSESLDQWELNKTSSEEIIVHTNSNIKYFIDPKQFMDKYEALLKQIIFKEQSQKTDEINYDNIIATADLLTDVGIKLLEKAPNVQKLFAGAENVEKLKHLISRYLHHKNKPPTKPKPAESSEKGGLFASLKQTVYFIIIYFTKRKKRNDAKKSSTTKRSKSGTRKETPDLLREIVLKDSPLIPISDFIEIKPENGSMIEKIIADLRQHDLKIVIPIYNARQNLYVRRSKNYLISDVEYLMVDPEHAVSPESIYDYMDSIAGFQLKEDTLTGNILFSIEKYLFSTYRHNKTKNKIKK